MHLSISSSNHRIPAAPYAKLWLLTFVLFSFFAGLAEVFLRNAGHLKSITDDRILWGLEVDKIRCNKADVALVGASRIQLGFQVDRFEEKTGLRVANATITGCSAIPILRYIADETEFSGRVVVSLAAYHLVDDSLYPKSANQAKWYGTRFCGGG